MDTGENGNGEGEEWLSVPAAALRRGITQAAINKAVRQGRIQVRGTRRKRVVLWQEIKTLVHDKRGLLPGTRPAGASVRTARTADTARRNGKQHKSKIQQNGERNDD